MNLKTPRSVSGLLGLLLLLLAAPATAQRTTEGELLLPVFEVALPQAGEDPYAGISTLFAVGNDCTHSSPVVLTLWTNWGIPVLSHTVTIDPHAVRTSNLRDWLIFGRVFDRQLSATEIAHLQAALSGQPSPVDNMYYSTPLRPHLASGYMTVRQADSNSHVHDLWGDFFLVESTLTFAEAESMVRYQVSNASRELCDRHLLRFLQGGTFDGATHLVFWTGLRGFPSRYPEPQFGHQPAHCTIYSEAGIVAAEVDLSLLALSHLTVGDLGWPLVFGWAECTTPLNNSFLMIEHLATNRYGAGYRSYCPQPETAPAPEGAAVQIRKLVDGIDADTPPGPTVTPGHVAQFTYEVTNPGTTPLSSIVVTDDQGYAVTCPADSLSVNQDMTCTAQAALTTPGQHRNVGTVVASGPQGESVTDSNPAHALVVATGIALVKSTNGDDANAAPGPLIATGSPVQWTYQVTNTGSAGLAGVSVTDDRGVAVSCPKTVLAAGESMTCTAAGTALLGQYRNVGTATGTPSGGSLVTASDPSHYFGVAPGLTLAKLTNGEDANLPPGPTLAVGSAVLWTYMVANSGNVLLSQVQVSDDHGVAVTCPKSTLQPGEAMTCTGAGVAVAGQYANLGTATGQPPVGPALTATDPSHYFGAASAIHIKKYTNGHDADTPPGPTIRAGATITWTYVVTNTGNTALDPVAVSDDQLGAITCPRTSLAPGETMTCTRTGTAASAALSCINRQYRNVGTAVGTPPIGPQVTDTDLSHCVIEIW